MSGIVSAIVQIFFAWRIHIIGRTPFLSGFIVLLAITQCCAAIVQGIQAMKLGHLSLLQSRAFVSNTVWLVAGATCDVLIACSMTFFLWRGNSGFRQTSAIIHRLIRLTIAANVIIGLIFFLGLKKSDFYLPFALVLAKLYSNNMLAIFNSRIRIVGGRGHEVDDAIDGLVTDNRDILSRESRIARDGSSGPRTRVTSLLEFTTLARGAVSTQSRAGFTMDPINVHISVQNKNGDDSDSTQTGGVGVEECNTDLFCFDYPMQDKLIVKFKYTEGIPESNKSGLLEWYEDKEAMVRRL